MPTPTLITTVTSLTTSQTQWHLSSAGIFNPCSRATLYLIRLLCMQTYDTVAPGSSFGTVEYTGIVKEQGDWRKQQTSILQQQGYMLEHAVHSDCSFRVGREDSETQVFRAHKLILSRSSEVFDAMLYGTLPEKNEVRVTDIRPEVFEQMLKYIYTESLNSSAVCTDLVGLALAANKYLLYSLRSDALASLAKKIKFDEVWSCFDLANKLGESSLRKAALKVLIKNAELALRHEDMVDVDYATLVDIAQEESLNVTSEMTVISACLRWAQNQCESKGEPVTGAKLRSVLGEDVVSNLRLLTLTPLEFARGPGGQYWLTATEKLSIYQLLIDPNTNFKLAEGLCVTKLKRGAGSHVLMETPKKISFFLSRRIN